MPKNRSISLVMIALAAACLGAGVASAGNTPGNRVDSIESPELGRTGALAVGTSYRDLVLPVRLRLTAQGPAESSRSIGLRFWYPAAATSAKRAKYSHSLTMPDGSKHVAMETGLASPNAAAATGKFPLVVLSHGLGGWSEHLSRLGEHLASRGYVVVSIDHRDMPFATVPAFQLSFGNVMLDRSFDQRQVLARLADPKFARTIPALAAADPAAIGLIGYSMGGYGALATAGGAYDKASPAFAALPPAAQALATTPDPVAASQIKALILISPWGSQPESRVWNEAGLAQLTKPVLIVSGDQDDIVNFRQGVRWLFDSLKGTERHLLVYREGRHNIAGNHADLGSAPSPEVIGYAREPVWRQERLNQINQHFVTAFLDLTLKNDAAKRAYLDVPVPVASEGKWPMNFGELDRGDYAGDAQPQFWRGFQRRWAAGLELHRKSAGN